MKKFLFLMVAALAAMQLTSAPVDQLTAMRVAKNYLTNNLYAGKIMAPAALNPVLVKAEMGNTKLAQPVYYIYNTSTTFLVVAGDDRARQILMVGDQPLDMSNEMPDGLTYMLNWYKEQMEFLQNHPGIVVDPGTPSVSETPSFKAATYGPLLTCNWDQSAPYYNQCVFTYNGNTYQCVTGCPATSASMVMYYWKYPTAPTPSVPSYSFYLNDYYRVTAPALPSTTFDWANMKNTYRTYNTAQANAVATLMRYVGQAEKMDYGTDASGISSAEASKIVTMYKLFGYDQSTTRLVKKSQYSEANWALIIQNEMKLSRPIVYMGVASDGGHAFNVDGYRESDGLYHVNFGWSGYGNNWCAMNAFTCDGSTYSMTQQAIVGIQPPGGEVTYPILETETESIDFGTVTVGQSVSQTFHVTGMNLLTDVTVTRSGNAAFSASPETLTVEQVQNGADITVTFTPTTSSNVTATIYVKSPGAADLTVNVSGSGQLVPTITADPSEMNFTTTVGQPVTQNFTLKGYNLTGAVYLKTVNSTGGFSVDKSNVTKNNAMNGVEVAVTYNPSAPGNHSARVMLRSAGADTIYVNLTGTADAEKYTPVMQPANMDYVTRTSFRAEWTDNTYAGAVASYTLECTGDGNTVSIPNITEKNYVLQNLTAGAVYSYKVMALYNDGTQSAWSNTEQVTLLSGPEFASGDVNHDGSVDIADVTRIIDYLLGNSDGFYTDCGDVNGDFEINIADATSLIDQLLSGN